ncbi:hypothetical protein RRG08_032287 [Elysia crispata]|uniref:LIM zinc-binding domain-containing protein n=1 Tax=Elysia crispata TaxID=231223 RepID=A0AAE1ARE2_9GAST|nr:hypothetical protein RRG08_032287 [Elysia crispata]
MHHALYHCSLVSMDLNDEPVGTLLSPTGQVLEKELPTAYTAGTQTSDSSTLQPAGMHANPESSSATIAPLYRPVSPSMPSTTATFPSHTSSHSNDTVVSDDNDTPAPVMQSRTFQKVQQELEKQEKEENSSSNNNDNNNANIRGFKSVSAPVAKPPSERPQQQSMRCGSCDMLATGVIVKASGVPYHVACFKCASCSMNLKQKGFFVVEGKLYCETHARRYAKPPGPDMMAMATYR